MVWSIEDKSQFVIPPIKARLLHSFQPVFDAIQLSFEDNGGIGDKTLSRLSEPMAGVSIMPVLILNPTIYLPNGVCVELTRESVPDANVIASGFLFGQFEYPNHAIDKCHKLRISANGETLAEGRWQFNLNNFGNGLVRLSAGLFVDGDGLRVYAHVGHIPGRTYGNSDTSKETAAVIASYPLAFRYLSSGEDPAGMENNGVFGSGISLYADCPGIDPQGIIEVFHHPLAFDGYFELSDMYAHPFPLEEKLEFVPSQLSINERESDSLAWGRHPSAMAIGPIGWRLSDLETDGHPEWGLADGQAFAGASRLFRNGREAAIVPASNHRSNVSPIEAENVRLKTLRIQWTWQGGVTTGQRDIGLLFGAWNEYRMESWASASGAIVDGRELTGVFIAAAITRIDATNLGSAIDQEDAIEITRFALRWFAATRFRYGNDFALPGWDYIERSVILSAADGGKLLAGETVTLSQPTVGDPSYLQGTYPTPSLTNINGTLTIQAIGS
jgi:hypothetical protein